MCDRPSALIHRTTHEIKAANLDSHSDTREALKITDKDQNWLEIEWPDGAKHIKVRVVNPDRDGVEVEWRDRIEAKHPNRQAFYAYCRKLAEKADWFYVASQEETDALPAKIAGRLTIEMLGEVKLPKLETSGDIYAPSVTSFSAPKLETSGDIYAPSVTSFSAPKLETSGYINANSATSFSAPKLETSGDIDARSATSANVPPATLRKTRLAKPTVASK